MNAEIDILYWILDLEGKWIMTDAELNARFGQLVDAQLRFQDQIGDLSGVVRQVVTLQAHHEQELGTLVQVIQQVSARQDRHEQELAEFRQQQALFEQRLEEFRQRQAESDQRFNVLLQEIRFLIRQQRPPQEEE